MASAVSSTGSQGALLSRAGRDALVKLDPRKLTGNPVILATEVVAVLATISTVAAVAAHQTPWFAVQIALWLWATVLFANFAGGLRLAEGARDRRARLQLPGSHDRHGGGRRSPEDP